MKKWVTGIALVVLIAAAVAWAGSYPISGGGGTSSFNPSTNTSPVQAPLFTSTAAPGTRGWEGYNPNGMFDNALVANINWTDNYGMVTRSPDNAASYRNPFTRTLFSAAWKAVTAGDNVVILPQGSGATVTKVYGCFFDNSGTISTSATDNITVILRYAQPDNVANVVTIDNTVVLGGTAIYSHAPNGTATVPAGAAMGVSFPMINSTKSFSYRVEGYLR